MSVRYISAVLFVKDMPAARHFYEDLLGQEVELDLELNVGYKSAFALWENKCANDIIFHRDPDSAEPLGRRNLELYFETEDLDAITERLRAAGVSLIHEIHEHPWGQRALRVYDPDGHIVEVGEPMPAVIRRMATQGLTRDQIRERTAMPDAMIDQALGE
jgi:catechol 2,3-dioxygenase-like lactoylglutathione lyase family enzyme